MTAPTRGIPITLDKERRLRYTLKTMREIETKRENKEITLTGVKDMAHLLWLGLRHEDPDLTEDAVAEMVDGENLPEVQVALERAFGNRGTNGTGEVQEKKETAPETTIPSG
jgi:hypothetical protein